MISMPFYTLTLLLTGIGLLLCLIMLGVTVLISRKGSPRGESDEMYIGGEHPSILSSRTPSIAALYWAFIKRVFRSMCRYLRESVHSGVLNEWSRYMSSWFGFLMFLALLVAIMTAYMLR